MWKKTCIRTRKEIRAISQSHLSRNLKLRIFKIKIETYRTADFASYIYRLFNLLVMILSQKIPGVIMFYIFLKTSVPQK
jgi:hypothetical protein